MLNKISSVRAQTSECSVDRKRHHVHRHLLDRRLRQTTATTTAAPTSASARSAATAPRAARPTPRTACPWTAVGTAAPFTFVLATSGLLPKPKDLLTRRFKLNCEGPVPKLTGIKCSLDRGDDHRIQVQDSIRSERLCQCLQKLAQRKSRPCVRLHAVLIQIGSRSDIEWATRTARSGTDSNSNRASS